MPYVKQPRLCCTIWLLWAMVVVCFASQAQADETEADPSPSCLQTDLIASQTIETDQRIRFTMQDGTILLMELRPHCPQLYFHGYFSYTPVNGRVCAGEDEIKTRAGLPCTIASIAEAKAPEEATQ